MIFEFMDFPIHNLDLYRPGFNIEVDPAVTTHVIVGKTIVVPSMYYFILNLWGPTSSAINACCIHALDSIYTNIDRMCKDATDNLNHRANRSITVPTIRGIYSN